VHKMTQKPAERFKLKGKGVIAAGMSADLVVFDLGDFADRATYAEPLIRPTGVVHVLVNGEFGIRSGEATAERAGRFVTVWRDSYRRRLAQLELFRAQASTATAVRMIDPSRICW
jgi:N-acyl-D-aspartate/D-glutamate deacylase